MTKRFSQFVVLAVVALLTASGAWGQASSVGTLTGTVTDATGAVISGADISAKDEATGATLTTRSGADGTFTIASMKPGTYTVSVTMSGFKKGEFRNVKIVVGQIYDLTAKMEVGEVQSTVVIEAGAEVLETASTTIGGTVTGRAIQTLPLASRDALDLATLVPGAATTGRARQTSFMGLPKGAINITIDGINAQDNILKSSDGFFTIIRPRVDSIEEFSISTAGQGADQSSEGAVQIRFETKRGGNEYHGGGWWQHRNDFFNSNYYFSNLAGTPRQRQRLNQFGGQVGGPILKEKLFFFVAEDNYRNPNSQVRSRTILAPNALTGIFDYRPGDCDPATAGTQACPAAPNAWTTCANGARGANGTGQVCSVNINTLLTNFGFPAMVMDPVTGSILSAVNSSRTAAGVSLLPIPDAHTDLIQFNNPGDATRRFPDVRLDYNPTKSHQVSMIYHYNYFFSGPDFLNNFDRSYPVAPFDAISGSQISNRNEWVGSWRWNLAANKSNEVRWGLQTAPVSFFPDLPLNLYPTASTNAGSIIVRPSLPLISQPFLANSIQGRNTPISQLIETFSWTMGKHSFTFGGNWTALRLKQFFSRAAHTATINLPGNDPVSVAGVFGTTNMPGSSATQQGNAAALFALLTGRVSAYSGTVSATSAQRAYVTGANGLQRVNQDEIGIYGQDQWRIFPTLTINYGLRWEFQGAPKDPDNLIYRVAGQINGLYGISGPGNLFAPGTLTGSHPLYELNGDSKWYNNDLNNFAPNLGLSWTPGIDNKFYNMLFGGPGKTVIRAGYSVTFTREGLNNFNSIAQSNPGFNATIQALNAAPGGACPANSAATPGTYPAGCMTLNNLTTGSYLQSLTTNPPFYPDSTSFSIRPNQGFSTNAFDPDLAIPLVHNWNLGIQREINPNLVVEVRYVGNHGQGLWRQDNLNEVNIFENGFLQEFLNAQNNLAICRANANACLTAGGRPLTTSTGAPNTERFFSNLGLPGQVPVPILSAAFTASTTGSQANAFFRNATFINNLDNGLAGTFANSLAFANSGQFICNMAGSAAFLAQQVLTGASGTGCPATVAGAGFPVNFFVVNPHSTGGAFRFYNGTHSTYNGLVLEARHRPAKGLQFNANYTWSKSLTNLFADSSVNFQAFDTFRNQGRNKGPSPWDLRHVFKMQMIYELPFGAGKRWSSSQAWANHVIGGWEISAIQRWQSGRIFLLTSGNGGTVNQYDSGVILTGITTQQIQEMLKIRKTPTGQVFYFPASLIGSDGRANTAFIRPCNTPGAFCQRPFLYGPMFYRADISVIKNFKITERVRLQYRAEFLNAFNNINFFYPGSETTSVPTAAVNGTSFGVVTNAFRDVSTTDDNGGRIIQMVFRINF